MFKCIRRTKQMKNNGNIIDEGIRSLRKCGEPVLILDINKLINDIDVCLNDMGRIIAIQYVITNDFVYLTLTHSKYWQYKHKYIDFAIKRQRRTYGNTILGDF